MSSKHPPRPLLEPIFRSPNNYTHGRQPVEVPRPRPAVAHTRGVQADAAGEFDGLHGRAALHEEEAFRVDADFGEGAVAAAGARGFGLAVLVLEVADFLLDGGFDVALFVVVIVRGGLSFYTVDFFSVLVGNDQTL